MALPLDVCETSQEFGSGATAGIVANSNRNSGMGYYVWLYGNYQPNGHAGKDLKAKIGTPLYAIADGTVLYAGWCEDLPGTGNVRRWLLYYNFGGIVTVIQHQGWISITAHQSSNDEVTVGQRVKAGQLIGKSGNTKTRTTFVEPHVHIEALVYNDYRTDVKRGIIYGRVDPTPFFGQGIAAQGEVVRPEAEPAPPTPEEDTDMLYVTKAKGDSVIWIGNMITRRPIGDVAELTVLREYAKAGVFKIYKNGDTQDWPPAYIGKAV